MHRILERLDASFSTLVPLCYLAALFLGTAAYFSGVIMDAGAAVGVSLAVAAEVHAFLEQRRVRAAFAQWRTASEQRDDAPKQPWHADPQLRLHLGILLALVAFSTYNSVAFTASTWRPPTGFLPAWLQIGVRGAVIPAFFLLTGALSPLHVDAGETLAQAASEMLHTAMRATVKQWRGRIKRARKSGLDLAPVAVALMLDAGNNAGARRVQLIADGLAAAEQGQISGAQQRHLLALTPAMLTYPTTYDDTGAMSQSAVQLTSADAIAPVTGTPTVTVTSPTTSVPSQESADVATTPAAEPARSTPHRGAARRATTRKRATSGKGVSQETQARAAWSAGARTVNAMREATGMSKNAASGWVRTLKAEAHS